MTQATPQAGEVWQDKIANTPLDVLAVKGSRVRVRYHYTGYVTEYDVATLLANYAPVAERAQHEAPAAIAKDEVTAIVNGKPTFNGTSEEIHAVRAALHPLFDDWRWPDWPVAPPTAADIKKRQTTLEGCAEIIEAAEAGCVLCTPLLVEALSDRVDELSAAINEAGGLDAPHVFHADLAVYEGLIRCIERISSLARPLDV
jgi:hypothetical protein